MLVVIEHIEGVADHALAPCQREIGYAETCDAAAVCNHTCRNDRQCIVCRRRCTTLSRAPSHVSSRGASGWSMVSEPRSCARSAAHIVRHLQVSDTLRIGGRQCGGTLGPRRIDPHSVDLLLGLLCPRADHLQFPVPTSREDRASLSQVETGGVSLLVIWLGGDSQQFGGGVVAGKGAHPRGVLARHQRVVAEIVAGCRSGIGGGESAGC